MHKKLSDTSSVGILHTIFVAKITIVVAKTMFYRPMTCYTFLNEMSLKTKIQWVLLLLLDLMVCLSSDNENYWSEDYETCKQNNTSEIMLKINLLPGVYWKKK